MKGTIDNLAVNMDGQLNVMLTVPRMYADDLMRLKDDPVSIDIKKYREKRSLSANALMWCVCQELSDALGPTVTKEDVYRRAVREVGTYAGLSIRKDAVDMFARRWTEKGIGWFVEVVDDDSQRDHVLVFAYYGSSTYETDEMSRLLDYLIDEAEQIGIVLKAGPELEKRARELGVA